MRLFTILSLSLLLTARGQATGQAAAAKSIEAKAPVVTAQNVDGGNRSLIRINFDNPLPRIGDISSPASWIIYIKSQDGKNPPVIQKLEVDWVDTSAFTLYDMITLNLKSPVPATVKALDTTLLTSSMIVHFAQVTNPNALMTAPEEPTGGENAPVTASTSRADSDIYFNGSYTATVDGSPVYNIDAFAGYMKALQNKNKSAFYGRLGVYGQVTTKNSATIDPNSFLAYLVYQQNLSFWAYDWYGPFQNPYFNFRLAGWESDKTGAQINFISSPVMTLPIRFSGKIKGAVKPGFITPHMALNLGTEFVDVQKSVLAPTGDWHTRGLASALFTTGYTPAKPLAMFASIKLTSSYQVRILSAPEIFYDPEFGVLNKTTGKTVIPAMLGTQPRHYVDTKLSYNFAKWVGFTFENTYGSLPPVFLKTDQTFAVGVSLTLKQSNSGRYSILRP